jgi:hypothetical protein
MEQIRVPLAEVEDVLATLLGGAPWAEVAARHPRHQSG